MDGDAGDDERNPGHLDETRDLPEDDDPDHGGCGREERDEERVGRPPHPGHRELVEHVRNHRGRDPDPDPRSQQDGVDERRRRVPAAERQHRHPGDEHGGGEAVDPAHPALGDPVRKDDVRSEEDGV